VSVAKGREIPTPAVAGDEVIVSGGFGSYDVYCFDSTSGRMRWHRRSPDDGPTAAVVWDRYVLYNTESCTLEALDRSSGRELWALRLGDPLLAQPAIGGARAYAVYPSAGEHRLGAFALIDGRELWSARIGHDAITAPVYDEERVYLATFDGCVRCLDAATGELEWMRDMRATSAPWVRAGEVFVSHRDEERADEGRPGPRDTRSTRTARPAPTERTSRYRANDGAWVSSSERKLAVYLRSDWGAGRKRAYAAADGAVGFASAPAAAKLEVPEALLGERLVSRTWRHQGSRPVVRDGVLFDTTGGRLEARDARSDALIWTWSAPEVEGERSLTPPAVTNGRVWVGTWDGRIVCLDAANGAVLRELDAGGPLHWQPVVSAGRVFAGTAGGELVAFQTGDARDDGWPMWGGGPGHNG
jgi:outer membrane protein assembly factor BamB